jgi:hypothetical protein
MIMIADWVENGWVRPEMTIALVYYRGHAINVLETINGKPIISIAEKWSMLPWSLNVVTS